MLTTLRCPLCRFFTNSVEELEGHVRVKHLVSEVHAVHESDCAMDGRMFQVGSTELEVKMWQYSYFTIHQSRSLYIIDPRIIPLICSTFVNSRSMVLHSNKMETHIMDRRL